MGSGERLLRGVHPGGPRVTADAGPCIVWIAGAGADYASTRYAVTRGGVEANPLQASPGAQAAAQAGYAAAGCWADHKLRSKGRPGLARGLRIAAFVLKVGLAVHNVRKVR